jgi:Tol biopolymer transport system component
MGLRPRTFAWLLIWAAGLGTGAAMAQGTPAVARPADSSGTAASHSADLLFTSMRTGSSQIFRIDADGRGEARLTQTETAELQPVWSRSGRVAFVSYRTGGGDVYTMDATGADLRRVSTAPGLDQSPAWSPDGRRIAYVSERADGTVLAIADADGRNETMVSGLPSDVAWPEWSPDGTKIAIVGTIANKPRILIADLKAGDVRPLTQGAGGEFGPAWSPDGGSIAYVQSGSRTEGVNLRLARPGHAGTVALTQNGYINSQPRFSPDGSKILYLSNAASQGGVMKLHVMNADGGGSSALTRWDQAEMSGVWSADGRQIFFMSFHDWPGQIYRAEADGSGVRRLTQSTFQEGPPVARPVPVSLSVMARTQ